MPRLAPPAVLSTYLELLSRAIVTTRFRIREGETISQDEMHDLLQALHNIPTMLRDYGSAGGWFVEENVDRDLLAYDQKWACRGDSELRESLAETLQRAREGEQAQG
jgi:aminoglycoside phosphotransferase (APT) family kinase protein